MGLKKNNPGCGCCEEAAECIYCDGTTPQTISVTFSGWANDVRCDNCAIKIDDITWVCSQNIGEACRWDGGSAAYMCSFYGASLVVTVRAVDAGSGQEKLRVTVSITAPPMGDVHIFETAAAATISCTGTHDAPYVSSSAQQFCDPSGVTCTIN